MPEATDDGSADRKGTVKRSLNYNNEVVNQWMALAQRIMS